MSTPSSPGRLPATCALLALGLGAAATAGARPVPEGLAHAQSGARTWARTSVRAASFAPDAMLEPRGIDDAPGGRFYVADSGRDRVVVVDAGGAIVRTFGSAGDGPTGLRRPADVAVDAGRDRLYVVDRGNRRVAVFTLAGVPIAHWRSGGPEFALVPWAVAVAGGTGEVYVLSRLPWGRIDRFTPEGRWLSGWGAVGAGAGEFYYPEDLVVAPDGRLIVADTNNDRLQLFDVAGAYLASWAGLGGVRAVDVDPTSGQVYALCSGDRIAVFLSSGTALREIRADALRDSFSPGTRLAVGDGGRLAVTTGFGAPDARQGVRQYDPDDTLVASTLADPRAHPRSFRPDALAVGPSGALYVLDGPVRTTRRYAPDGSFLGRLDEAVGDELAIGPGGEVYVVSTAPTGPVRVRRVTPDDRADWELSCPCFSGMGAAASADALFLTESLSHTLAVFQPGQAGEVPLATLTVPGAPYAWPLDVARGPDGRLYVAGGETGRVDVFDAGGALAGSWSVGDALGAERIAAGADGTVFALLYDGTVAVWNPDGTREADIAIAPAPGERLVRPRDLAAGPDGRLYVLDDHTHAVFVFDPSPSAPPTTTPETTPASPCTITGDKVASPTEVSLGDAVTVRLSLDIRCPPGSEPRADIVLVVDRSNSMSGSKLEDAKAAAAAFVTALELGRHQVALVSFSDMATLDQPLTDAPSEIRSAIAAVHAHGGTDIAAALDLALRQLADAGRPGALGVVLLLTDGEPTGLGQPYVDPVRLGGRARAAGVLVYTIGLGVNVDAELLVAVAGARSRYFFAPTEGELDAIYRQLSGLVGGAVATDVQVVDELGPDVDYVSGSASGSAVVSGREVTWAIGAVPEGGIAPVSLAVRPRRTGRLPTNARAVASYVADGVRYTYVFTVPEVVVVDRPTATATPTPTRTPHPTGPSTAFLPIVATGRCDKDRRLPADIVLVIDTSSSMAGDKVARAVAAGKYFVFLLAADRDRVGLVAFSWEVRRFDLTGDLASISRALDAVTTQEGTRIDAALAEALAVFQAGGRAGVARVAVLLTDGQPSAGTRDAALAQADRLRAEGVSLFTIGLGADADAALLQDMADTPTHYYHAPTAVDLSAIYDRIAVRLPCR